MRASVDSAPDLPAAWGGVTWRVRRLRPREVDHELIWLLVSVATVALAAAWLLLRIPVPPCVFHRLTGLPCPTCGATRCAVHLLHLRPGQAFLMNPLLFLGFVAIAVYDAYALIVLVFRLPRVRDLRLPPRAARLVRIGVAVVVLANWAYLIVVL